jgi:hypothetical protein
MAPETIAQSAASHSNHFNQIEFLHGMLNKDFRTKSQMLVHTCIPRTGWPRS